MSLADEYDRLGVVHVRSLLNDQEVGQIRDAFMDQVVRDRSIGHDDHVPEGDPLKQFPRFVHPHRRADLEVGLLSRRLMLDPRIIGRVQEILGPVFAAQSMFYFKPPTARGQAMHQDNLFLQAHPETCIAAWIAIDDCDGENGGLKMVPGSHRYELVCPEDANEAESFTNAEIKLPDGMVAEQTVLKAGDVLFFHGSMVHGSGPQPLRRPVPPIPHLPLRSAEQHRDRAVLQPPPHPRRPRGHRVRIDRRWRLRRRLDTCRPPPRTGLPTQGVPSGLDPG